MSTQTSTAAIDGGIGLLNTPEIYVGADYYRDYQWLDETNAPIDLSGAIGASAFSKYDYSANVFTATVTITDAVNGKFRVSIVAATTGAATPVLSNTAYGFGTVNFYERDNDYELLRFNVELTLGGLTTQVVRGVARFYNSAS